MSYNPHETLSPSCHVLSKQQLLSLLFLQALFCRPLLWGLGHTGPGVEPNQTGWRWAWCGHSRFPWAGPLLAAGLAQSLSLSSLPQSCKFNAGSRVPASGKETPPPSSASTHCCLDIVSFRGHLLPLRFLGHLLPLRFRSPACGGPSHPCLSRGGRSVSLFCKFHFSAMQQTQAEQGVYLCTPL